MSNLKHPRLFRKSVEPTPQPFAHMSGFLLHSSPQTSSTSITTQPSSHLTLQQLSSRIDPAFSSTLLLHSNLSHFTSASFSHQAFSQSVLHFPELFSSSTASLAVAIISHATPPVTDMNEDTTRNSLQTISPGEHAVMVSRNVHDLSS